MAWIVVTANLELISWHVSGGNEPIEPPPLTRLTFHMGDPGAHGLVPDLSKGRLSKRNDVRQPSNLPPS